MCWPSIVQTSVRSICSQPAPSAVSLDLPLSAGRLHGRNSRCRSEIGSLRRTACARRACSLIFEATSRRKRGEFIACLTAAVHPSDIAPCSSV